LKKLVAINLFFYVLNMWILLFITCLSRAVWGTIPLLILKQSRSGSTFFVSQLNSYKGVYVAAEVIRGESYQLGNVWKEGQAHLYKSFSTPTRSYPWDWDEKHKKPEGDFAVLGATLDTTYVDGYVNWTEIALDYPNLKLVVFQRTNIVKHAISRIRVDELLKKCHKRHSQVGAQCEVDDKFYIDVELLGRWIIKSIAYDDESVKTALGLTPYLDNWFYMVDYEELVGDVQGVLDNLFEWIGYDTKERVSQSYGRCVMNCTKITSDDLRNAILNYNEVETYISTEYPCLLPHLQETNPGKVMHPLHSSCGFSVFDERAQGAIRWYKNKDKINRKTYEDCCLDDRYNCECKWPKVEKF